MKYFLLLFFPLFIAVSCVKGDDATGRMVSVAVAADGELPSRVSVAEDWSVSWVEGESLMAWSALDSSLSEFKMTKYGAYNSTFDGKVTGESYRLVSPYNLSARVDQGHYVVDLSTQQANMNSTYMISDDVLSTTSQQQSAMKHIGSAISLNIKFTESQVSKYYLTAVELSDAPSSVEVNLAAAVGADDFYGDQTIGSIVASLDEKVEAQGIVCTRFNVIPFAVESQGVLSLKLHFVNDKGTALVAPINIINDSSAARAFERAKYSKVNWIFDLSTLDVANGDGISLSEISIDAIPESDKWIITDETAESTDFAGLSEVINFISDNDAERKISLEFPNLKSFPTAAIYGSDVSDDSVNLSALVSVSADAATTVGESAFYHCIGLEHIAMPSVVSVDKFAFAECEFLREVELPAVSTLASAVFNNCKKLSKIELSTAEGTILSSMSKYTFYGSTSTKNIDLTIGSANEPSVNGNTLTVGSVSKVFKSITLK